MPFGDPDGLKGEKALAFRTLTQALSDLVGIVEHKGRRVPTDVGAWSEDLSDKPEEREKLLAEVTDWFLNPDQGACSLNLICAHLGYNPEAGAIRSAATSRTPSVFYTLSHSEKALQILSFARISLCWVSNLNSLISRLTTVK